MKKLSPEFCADAKKKCKKPLIAVCIVSAIALLALVVVLCIKPYTAPQKELPYDDPVKVMMGNPNDSDDHDNDLLKNDVEKEIGTDPYSADTDEDGLGDYYEAEYSGTDPLKVDTDGDGLSDYVELKANLDPRKASSNDEIPDAERVFEETYRGDNVKIEFTGNANIYNVYCGPFDLPGLAQTPGVMSSMVEIYTKGALPAATLTFSYDDDDIEALGGTEANLGIFVFTDDGKFEKVENSTHDTEKNTISCALHRVDRYILCDGSMISADHKNQIMLLIDNSGSMFPEEMCEGSEENDVDFKRLEMAKSIIENISEDTYYGLGKFTGTYTHMAGLGTDKETLFSQIDGIRDIEEEFNGTYIATSIIKSLENFTDDHSKDRKFVIILTDGGSTEHSGLLGFLSGNPTEYDVVRKCNEANVTVITIALGNDVDAGYLQTISNGTGGAYIYANNADALEDVYDAVFKSLVYSAEDLDDDGTTDSFIVADSGFDMSRNGYSFENLALLVPKNSIQQHGVCYGMALLAQAYYREIDIYSGDAFTAKPKCAPGKTYEFDDFDITAQLAAISNLRDLDCDIAEKWTDLHAIPSKERYVCSDGVLLYAEGLLEQYQDEYFTVQYYEDSGTFGGQQYNKVQMVYIDLEKYMAQDTVREDMEVVKTLYALWGAQDAITGEYRVDVNVYDLRNDWSGSATEDEFDELAELLKAGIPLVINFDSPIGSHAINAARLLRDVDNPLVYYLECYDNNDRNEPYIFKIERSDIDFWTKTTFENWSENYCYRTYMKDGDEWVKASLEFEEIVD
ncbi:MAG: VWA domain-containing protein [Bacteroidaceae bacterium]|nr:VWA domain-containing protein [Bacteroidaceae bacterium]